MFSLLECNWYAMEADAREAIWMRLPSGAPSSEAVTF